MELEIFGNSITNVARFDTHPPTFVDLLQTHFNQHKYQLMYRSRARCSEERILYFLKKIKVIDVAIIFHAAPSHEFFPSCFDDFNHGTIDDEDLDYMIENNVMKYFHKNIRDNIPPKCYDTEIYYDGITTRNILAEHHRLFYNIDLQRNRYLGAITLIDQYLTAKKIPVIHCINPKYIPSWFKFSSGVVNTEFSTFQYEPPYNCSYTQSHNAITAEGNVLIADTFIKHINTLLKLS